MVPVLLTETNHARRVAVRGLPHYDLILRYLGLVATFGITDTHERLTRARLVCLCRWRRVFVLVGQRTPVWKHDSPRWTDRAWYHSIWWCGKGICALPSVHVASLENDC